MLFPCFTGILQSLIYKKQERAQVLGSHKYSLKFICSFENSPSLFPPAPGNSNHSHPKAWHSSVGCGIGWNYVPGKQAKQWEIKQPHSLLLFSTPFAALVIPHLLLATLQFLLSSWKRKVVTSCPPAALDIQRAVILPAQDKQENETASAPAPLPHWDTGMLALSCRSTLDRQVLSDDQPVLLGSTHHLVLSILEATIVSNECDNTFLLMLIKFHLPIPLLIWKPHALCITLCSHPSKEGKVW